MNNIVKTDRSLENSDLLMRSAIETVKHEI